MKKGTDESCSVRRERSKDRRTESFEESFRSVGFDSLDGAIYETFVGSFGRTLKSGFDDLFVPIHSVSIDSSCILCSPPLRGGGEKGRRGSDAHPAEWRESTWRVQRFHQR